MDLNRFITIQKIDAGFLLLNGLTGAMDYCDTRTGQLLLDRKLQQIEKKTYEKLEKGNYILDRETEEHLIQKLNDYSFCRNRESVCLLMIPTYNCNFRCPYCYEKWRLENGREWLEKVMTRQQADCYFNLLDMLADRQISSLTFYGGEPLLPETKEIVAHILEQATERKIKRLSAVTNGYWLEDFIDLFKKYGLDNIQITLDGMAENHNRRRFLAGGGPTFDKIIQNIDLALDAGIKVSLRSNIDMDNVEDVDALKKLFESRGWTKKENFLPYFSKTTYKEKNNCADVDVPNRFKGTFLNAVKQQRPLRICNTFCGAEEYNWICDPYGDVYSCFEVVGDQTARKMHISPEGIELLDGISEQVKDRVSNKMEKCRECPYCFLCGGGCMMKAKIKTGDYFREDCDEVPEQIPAAMISVGNQFLQEKGVTAQKEGESYLISLIPSMFTDKAEKD